MPVQCHASAVMFQCWRGFDDLTSMVRCIAKARHLAPAYCVPHMTSHDRAGPTSLMTSTDEMQLSASSKK
jgi:hypothetical protein